MIVFRIYNWLLTLSVKVANILAPFLFFFAKEPWNFRVSIHNYPKKGKPEWFRRKKYANNEKKKKKKKKRANISATVAERVELKNTKDLSIDLPLLQGEIFRLEIDLCKTHAEP